MATKTVQRVRLGAKRQLRLPLEVTTKFGLRKGDLFDVRVLKDRIVLEPLIRIPKDRLWFWTEEWQTREREADADLAAGRFKEFRSAAEGVASLKSRSSATR